MLVSPLLQVDSQTAKTPSIYSLLTRSPWRLHTAGRSPDLDSRCLCLLNSSSTMYQVRHFIPLGHPLAFCETQVIVVPTPRGAEFKRQW